MILVRPIVPIGVGYHFGLWVAQDEVVHAAKGESAICTSLAEFAAGRDVAESRYSLLRYEPEVAIKRAREAIGTWKYDLMETNCEAFVLWCITGEKDRGLQAQLIDFGRKVAVAWLAPQSSPPTPRDRREQEVQKILEEYEAKSRRNQEQFQREMTALQEKREKLLEEFEEQCRKSDELFERLRVEAKIVE